MSDPRIQVRPLYRVECTVCGPDGDALESDCEDRLWAELLGSRGEGWVRLDDGRILCPAHYRASRCDEHDHLMLGWADHPLDDGLQWRFCQRCGASFEQRVRKLPTKPASLPKQ